jgi:hypothetical protein
VRMFDCLTSACSKLIGTPTRSEAVTNHTLDHKLSTLMQLSVAAPGVRSTGLESLATLISHRGKPSDCKKVPDEGRKIRMKGPNPSHCCCVLPSIKSSRSE